MSVIEVTSTIALPDPSLILLLGARGSGKSTFARRFFQPSEIVSLDECRRMVGDSGPAPSNDALELFQTIVQNRLHAGKFVVIDGDHGNADLRRNLVTLAKRHHLFAIAIALQLDERICVERNASRSDGAVSPYDVKRGAENVRKFVEAHVREGVRELYVLDSPEAMEKAVITRRRLWTDKQDDAGPFDIIGDVHGCAGELEALLELLGYQVSWDESFPNGVRVIPPEGRRVIFLGDLIDRGPRIVDCLRIAMSMVNSGAALCVPGNHESKFLRKLRGKTVSITHGLAETVAEFEKMPLTFHEEVATFIEKLVGHYVLDDGRLCVVHAGIKQNMQGRSSSAAREFGLYGDTTGETDEYGLPVRHEWATEYHGKAAVVYGHTPMLTAEWLNNTICVDTGCVFGGALTALRYPEREIISVPAAKRYFEPKKPLVARVSQAGSAGEAPPDEGLNLDSLRGGGVIKTRFRYDVAIPEEAQILATTEVLTRFGVDPRWLVYVPPGVSPVDGGSLPGTLEHPVEAFRYYRRHGVSHVVCQEKRLGTRVVVVLCRNESVARTVFGTVDERAGIVYSRTGRNVFTDRKTEESWIQRWRGAAEEAKLFDSYGPFIVFEAQFEHLGLRVAHGALRPKPHLELPMPAAVVTHDELAFDATLDAISRAKTRGIEVGPLAARIGDRRQRLARHAQTLEQAAQSSSNTPELRIEPLHVLATDETSWFDRPHSEHAALFQRLRQSDEGLFASTSAFEVRLDEAGAEERGFAFWEEWTARGKNENLGLIIKPVVFQRNTRPGFVLPALECHNDAALRVLFGPEYDVDVNLERLRRRSLAMLRFRALNQFMLGMESIARFVEREPLSRIHACACVSLALDGQRSEFAP
jgi:protein phosphatase